MSWRWRKGKLAVPRNLLTSRLLRLNIVQLTVHALYHWRSGLRCVNEVEAQ